MKKLIAISIISIILTSCISEQHNIVVSGKILDSKTNIPISNAEVVALCWYQNNIDDVTFTKKVTTTDKKGHYKLQFDKGYQIDIASKAENYNPNRIYNKLDNNNLNVDLELTQMTNNNSLIVNLTTMNLRNEDEAVPYLRQRLYSNPTTNELDFSTAELWGYDFINSRNTPLIGSADIWLKSILKQEHSTVLIASSKGGIIPIYRDEVKNSLLFDKIEAPLNGYMEQYQLKGNEEGFFVRCRDGVTYGKLIMQKSKVDRSSPYENGYFKEWGYYFGSLYQSDSSRIFDYYLEIDLEQYLVDFRYK
jgi:hypothetical protein